MTSKHTKSNPETIAPALTSVLGRDPLATQGWECLRYKGTGMFPTAGQQSATWGSGGSCPTWGAATCWWPAASAAVSESDSKYSTCLWAHAGRFFGFGCPWFSNAAKSIANSFTTGVAWALNVNNVEKIFTSQSFEIWMLNEVWKKSKCLISQCQKLKSLAGCLSSQTVGQCCVPSLERGGGKCCGNRGHAALRTMI